MSGTIDIVGDIVSHPSSISKNYRSSKELKLLLDTHIWIWSLREPNQLAASPSGIEGDPNNDLWLSPVSTWEVLLLHARGRIQ